MKNDKKGRQNPTQSVILPYTKTEGQDAVSLYNKSGRTALPWQELLICDIMATNKGGLWVHTKFGYSVPRRNGKNEIIAMREMRGLKEGERILHTAHRTTTTHSAWERLYHLLAKAGIAIISSYRAYGKEHIEVEGGGIVEFRTRTSKGGLGEGFDLLIIDEAQEYQDDHESALKYVVTDSKNPQTIFCGTPPTPVSSGTVFIKFRDSTLAGENVNAGWAEWSIETETNPRDKAAWYDTNPSLGYHLKERAILDEIGNDDIDFMIQRLGYWIRYSLKSAISEAEWMQLKETKLPNLRGKLFVGVKYGKDGNNVALSIAAKTDDGRIFLESVDCRSTRSGNAWIIEFLKAADIKKTVIDGANGQQLLSADMKNVKLKTPLLPTVKEIIAANAMFEQAIWSESICHMGQPSLIQSASNCEKRQIGTNGGFGYKSIKDGVEVALLDSVVLAHWAASTFKEVKKQKISY